jgi:hypothetical protein
MNLIQSMAANVTTGNNIVLGRLKRRMTDREPSDVPGSVLITLMTAGVVTLVWSLVATKMTALYTKATCSVPDASQMRDVCS